MALTIASRILALWPSSEMHASCFANHITRQAYPGRVFVNKTKNHTFMLRDGMADIYGSHENVPETFIVPDRIYAMQEAEGIFRPG